MTSKDSLILSIQGTWKGFKGEPIWDIRSDSIYYYSENRSYYYFIHNDDMIILYKNGPFRFKNIRVTNDTVFFKTGGMNISAFKSENSKSIKFKENYFKNSQVDKLSYYSIKNNLLGEWGYENKAGLFSWIFTKDSIFYVQLNKRYFCVQHDNDVIVLTEEDQSILRDIVVKSDTLSFTTQDNVSVKAHKIK